MWSATGKWRQPYSFPHRLHDLHMSKHLQLQDHGSDSNDLFATSVKFLPILSLSKRSYSRIRKPQMGRQAIKTKPPCCDFWSWFYFKELGPRCLHLFNVLYPSSPDETNLFYASSHEMATVNVVICHRCIAVSHAASLIAWYWPLHSSWWLKGTSIFKRGVWWFRLIEVCLSASLPSVFHGNRGIAYPLFLSWEALYMVDCTVCVCV